MPRFVPAAALIIALAIPGCQKKPAGLAESDRNLVAGNASDPALTAALEDQIMVDPALTNQSNRTALKSAAPAVRGGVPSAAGGGAGRIEPGAALTTKRRSTPAPVRVLAQSAPMTLGARASAQAARARGCSANVAYGAAWATRLPPEFPVYPRGRLLEAAGSDTPACRLRVVSFTTEAPVPDVMDYYYTRATQAGFAAEHQRRGNEDVLGGTRGDSAFYVTLSARKGGGTNVDLVANNGR